MNIKFLKFLYNEDTIYHYTKASTAIDSILYNKTLKFSQGQKSNDPIESRNAHQILSFRGTAISSSNIDDVSPAFCKIESSINSLKSRFHQVCFCKNQLGYIIGSQNYSGDFLGNEEAFGFTKPRMWEQYGDNYTGVCLAFSKNKILELNNAMDLLPMDIEYLTYLELYTRKQHEIGGNHLLNVGSKQAEATMLDAVKDSFNYKHRDYEGENEFRIGTLYEKKKATVEEIKGNLIFSETMVLQIKECIRAIFMSSYANSKQKEELLDYAKELKIPIFELTWQYNSIKLQDYKQWQQIVTKICR